MGPPLDSKGSPPLFFRGGVYFLGGGVWGGSYFLGGGPFFFSEESVVRFAILNWWGGVFCSFFGGFPSLFFVLGAKTIQMLKNR